MLHGLMHPRGQKTRKPVFSRRLFSATLIALSAVMAVTSASTTPDIEVAYIHATPEPAASLAYSGTGLIITGSVEHMFDDQTFSGPNRSAKGARKRPNVDVLQLADSFGQARTHLAAIRADSVIKSLPNLSPQRNLPNIAVAAIDPALMSAALDAIDNFAGSGAHLGLPQVVPQRLAYARANTPATKFKTPVSRKVSQKESWCLATAIYFEARGESYRGQVGVAQVVMNRVNHKLYPNSICGVVFQNQSKRNACQFSFACDGIPERVNDKKSWAQAEEIAKQVTGGALYLTEVANATHYHATYVYPRWAPRLKRLTKIGLHIFYRFKNG